MDPWHRRAPGRFIPAGAGNTQPCSPKRSVTPVYPRWRGEHGEAPRPPSGGRGLSPLARGTPRDLSAAAGLRRFIPARAGNTQLLLWSATVSAVYPRWRGEHAMVLCAGLVRCGLSPLARGTLVSPPHRKRWCRFIPAGAGNTLSVTHSSNYQPVYPRWRGEHPMDPTFAVCVTGLSPLARGTHGLLRPHWQRYRFIPAGAGNTFTSGQHAIYRAVYPRWRGEHLPSQKSARACTGLSPLARGTQAPEHFYYSSDRFIPAGAGNATPGSGHGFAITVYPRWRGEHSPGSAGAG